ncbi:uncharacterized protein LOC144765484 [Lissotriton helveticus]
MNPNVALKGITSQSSTYDEFGASANAIDGSLITNYRKQTCTHTDLEFEPWWMVDLGRVYQISFVVILNRGDCCSDRLNGAEVRIGNSDKDGGTRNLRCANIPSLGLRETVNLNCTGMKGRYVTITIPGHTGYLTLCEVQVHGVPAPDNATDIDEPVEESEKKETSDSLATAGACAMDEPSQSPTPEGKPSDADSLAFLDEASPTTQTPAVTSTITTAVSNTVHVSVAANNIRDTVQRQDQASPQAHGSRVGGRPTGGQSQEDNETEAQATVQTVLGAYQQNQGQMGQVLEELRELRRLQSSIDTRLGQIAEHMAQHAGVLRDMHAAQIAAHLPPRDQPDDSHKTSAAATGRGESHHSESSETSAHAAGSLPAKGWRGHLKKKTGGSHGKAPCRTSSQNQR